MQSFRRHAYLSPNISRVYVDGFWNLSLTKQHIESRQRLHATTFFKRIDATLLFSSRIPSRPVATSDRASLLLRSSNSWTRGGTGWSTRERKNCIRYPIERLTKPCTWLLERSGRFRTDFAMDATLAREQFLYRRGSWSATSFNK